MRVRYAITHVPSSASAALEEPAQFCGPGAGAGTATTDRPAPGSGNAAQAAKAA
jgi:hypothetical protein